MATKTSNDVVTLALQIMNVIGIGESPDGDQDAIATAAYTALHEDLKTDYADLYYSARISWNSNAVPEEYYPHIAGILAGRLVEIVPCSQSGRDRALAAARTGDASIRRRLARNPNLPRFDSALSPRYNSSGRGIWR